MTDSMSYVSASEQARTEAEQARREAVARLLAIGLTPEQIAEALSLALEEVGSLSQSE